MRASEADILIIPGFRGSEPEHWQSRWEAKLPSSRRVVQHDWERPELAAWRSRIIEEVARAAGPAVLLAHSLGGAFPGAQGQGSVFGRPAIAQHPVVF